MAWPGGWERGWAGREPLVSKGGGGVVRGEVKAAEAGRDQSLKGLRY